MTYHRFAAFAFPVAALSALWLGWPRHTRPAPAPDAAPIAPAIVTVTQTIYRTAGADQPLAAPGPGPVAVTHLPLRPPPMPPAAAADAAPARGQRPVDLALDRERARLDARARAPLDAQDQALVQQQQENLLALRDLWTRVDAAASEDERIRLHGQARKRMGELLRLARQDREERLARVAGRAGITNPADRANFIQELERAVVETQSDWTSLFSRDYDAPSPP